MINQRTTSPVLTDRQYEVLALMLEGNNHRQIATHLGLATLTVQTHITTIWDSLCDPHNRSFARRLINSLQEGHSIAGVIAFASLRIGQQFQYQGQLYQRVDRVRDRNGPYNAVAVDGRRALFFKHIPVEVSNE